VSARAGGEGVVRARRGGPRLLVALTLVAMCFSCQGANTLEGSLGEVLDLGYTAVEVSVTGYAIIVSYVRPHLTTRDTVFRLVVYIDPTTVVSGRPIDLSPREDGSPRAQVTRSVGGDPIRTLAAIKTGELTLQGSSPDGGSPVFIDAPINGELRVTFGEGGDAGKGRTAFGQFRTPRVLPGS